MELFCLYYTSQFTGEVTAGLKKKRGRLAWSLGRFNSASKFKIQMISKNIKVIIPCYQPNDSIEGLEMKLLKCYTFELGKNWYCYFHLHLNTTNPSPN